MAAHVAPLRCLVARSHDDGTPAHVVERAVFEQCVATSVEVVHGSLNEAVFDVMAIGIFLGSHPRVLEGAESAVEE